MASIWMNAIAGSAILLSMSTAAPTYAQLAERQFVAGEIIVGYRSQEDRAQALDKLLGLKGKITVHGTKIDDVQIQPVSGSAVKIRIGFPTDVKKLTEKDKSSELRILREIASQIKDSDDRIRYAHPNWVLDNMSL